MLTQGSGLKWPSERQGCASTEACSDRYVSHLDEGHEAGKPNGVELLYITTVYLPELASSPSVGWLSLRQKYAWYAAKADERRMPGRSIGYLSQHMKP